MQTTRRRGKELSRAVNTESACRSSGESAVGQQRLLGTREEVRGHGNTPVLVNLVMVFEMVVKLSAGGGAAVHGQRSEDYRYLLSEGLITDKPHPVVLSGHSTESWKSVACSVMPEDRRRLPLRGCDENEGVIHPRVECATNEEHPGIVADVSEIQFLQTTPLPITASVAPPVIGSVLIHIAI
ncbi:hypothetical protein K0M31_005719 [Melipona bicolor]|uniref:Uncharacterized protein n=1 Tax=Melipona bicolor TaxID=60889 RepID=A0AA40FUN9_9HYME|nr:hypothetical protein K0M31_005719 [Melipona bicolor]